MTLRRSVLFYPALSVERWDEAMGSGADMVVFDLEDGTVPARRAEARVAVLPLYAGQRKDGQPLRLLRVNNPRTEDGLRDLLAVVDCADAPDGLILPKIEHAEEVRWVADVLRPRHPDMELVVLIESPRGIKNAMEIACSTAGQTGPQITCLFLGTADFSASIGSDLGWDALAHARAETVLAAQEAGIDAMDGVWFDPSDEAGLIDEAARIASMGFTGKASYDQVQIPHIHAAFTPTPAQVDWAERVLAAAAADPLGTARVDGKMVNESIARRARRILDRRPA
ncbi:MAG: CoA ester lyase [Alphaproteobacteria bacterium]|tara:strand:+ start:1241 stop:2089 length:849 start_codon:yes stop_codon:yes gene_type:complete